MSQPAPAPMQIDWLGIQQAARQEALADAEREPLEHGNTVAWAVTRFARTDGLSEVHVVDARRYEDWFALCGERIPEPALRVKLSPRLIQSLGRCRYCDEMHTYNRQHAVQQSINQGVAA